MFFSGLCSGSQILASERKPVRSSDKSPSVDIGKKYGDAETESELKTGGYVQRSFVGEVLKCNWLQDSMFVIRASAQGFVQYQWDTNSKFMICVCAFSIRLINRKCYKQLCCYLWQRSAEL